ncbi:MAG: hypothetical protein HUK03_09020 [Bacteroidaceae bacterium]|nr:hypothetical protein [Bacteroidaceae bacterium]
MKIVKTASPVEWSFAPLKNNIQRCEAAFNHIGFAQSAHARAFKHGLMPLA